jgi:hypothetical protein
LRNPKYTGYQAFGRRRNRAGRRVNVPPAEWLWSPALAHPAIIDRATWEPAQGVGRARHQP